MKILTFLSSTHITGFTKTAVLSLKQAKIAKKLAIFPRYSRFLHPRIVIVNQWRPFTMLVNARLTFISIDGSFYSLHSQVILTINPLALLHFLTDQGLHLATETEQDQRRLSLLELQSKPQILKPRIMRASCILSLVWPRLKHLM